jgi:hypothetical protein
MISLYDPSFHSWTCFLGGSQFTCYKGFHTVVLVAILGIFAKTRIVVGNIQSNCKTPKSSSTTTDGGAELSYN